MLHPHTRLEWISDAIGYGVVATQPIPRGTILWVLDPMDQVLDPAAVRRLGDEWTATLETYSFITGQGNRVLCWDFGRYMNHSCDPVSLSPGVDFEFAVRDIAVGEQITCDYGSLNLEHDMDCLCGAPKCRGVIRASDFGPMVPEWDGRLRLAVVDARKVTQPLLGFVKAPERLDGWVADSTTLPSARLHQRLETVLAATA